MFPKAKTGRPGKDLRLMFNAVLWIACSGAPWRDLPERFGSWKTVYSRFCKWRDERTLLKVFEHLKRMALIPQQSKPIRAVRELKKRAKDLEVNQYIGRS